jgi:hypothetical protein
LQRAADWLDAREGLSLRQQVAVFAAAALLVFSRLPSFLLHPQFYGEDGPVWYAQAYNLGWLHSLVLPDGGYLNTLQRLGAGLSMLVPFRWTPLVMAIFGLLIQCVPVTILLSSRCRRWGSLSTRACFALIYLCSPNAREIHIVLTNSHWHLVFAAFLLAFSSPPRGWAGRLFDIAVFAVAGVSGPFSPLLFPFVLLFWWLRRQPWTLVQAAITGAGAAVQLYFLTHESNRLGGALGVGVNPLIRIFGGEVIGASVLGGRTFAQHSPLHDPPLLLPLLGFAVGILVYAYVLRFANLELKIFTALCIALFAVSLKSPLMEANPTRWHGLMYAPSFRYWFCPMMAFLWGTIWCIRYASHRLVRGVAITFLWLLPIGMLLEWEYKPYTDYHFADYAERMRVAAPGTALTTPITPGNWSMTLVKKAP